MKVFISWSGNLAKSFASEMKLWLKQVLQEADPFTSQEDIGAGKQWDEVIHERLRDASAGIICLTRESLSSNWLFYEAGALATKCIDGGLVCTLLIDLESDEVPAPLARFQQSVWNDKESMRKLVRTINKRCGELGLRCLSEREVDSSFSHWWPRLRQAFTRARQEAFDKPRPLSQHEKLDEILGHVKEIRTAVVTNQPSQLDRLQLMRQRNEAAAEAGRRSAKGANDVSRRTDAGRGRKR